MQTTFMAAVENYLRAKAVSRGTRNEYFSTIRKWEQWGGGVPIEELQRKDVRAFLDWVYERAVADEVTNPGRTANKAREHLRAVLSWAWEQELIESPPAFRNPGSSVTRPGDTNSPRRRSTRCTSRPTRCRGHGAGKARSRSVGTGGPLWSFGRVLQLRRRYRYADPLAARFVGLAFA